VSRQCILAVFAHPDDEAYAVAGTLRKLSDEGVTTALVCATCGESGAIADPALATPETLAQVRKAELRASCRALGVRDLAFLGYQDGTLSEADHAEAVGRITYHIRRLRPQVVVTYDQSGLYGHPDHVAIHRLTVAAFERAGDARWYEDHAAKGLAPHAPSTLLFSVMLKSASRLLADQMRTAVRAIDADGDATGWSLDGMGVPDEEVSVIVPLSDHQFDAKMAALRAHRTQWSQDAPFARDRDSVRTWLGTEAFQVASAVHLPSARLDALWDTLVSTAHTGASTISRPPATCDG
jgi:LmbE family N-acetylglucosaminyl deacetylase